MPFTFVDDIGEHRVELFEAVVDSDREQLVVVLVRGDCVTIPVTTALRGVGWIAGNFRTPELKIIHAMYRRPRATPRREPR